jgi:hypothetical protein
MAAAKWSPSRLLAARHINLIALPIAHTSYAGNWVTV